MYGLDARAVVFGPEAYGVRRLWSLISGLPPASALGRAVSGTPWTDDTYLLAAIADRVGVTAAGRVLRSVPELVPRPHIEGPKPEVVTSPEDVVAFFTMMG